MKKQLYFVAITLTALVYFNMHSNVKHDRLNHLRSACASQIDYPIEVGYRWLHSAHPPFFAACPVAKASSSTLKLHLRGRWSSLISEKVSVCPISRF